MSYWWPVKPFRAQHPIRAFFGDPRTVFTNAADPREGMFSFHNGIDISSPGGTPVYPVLSGVVVKARPDEIVVSSPGQDRRFQYWHLIPSVQVGERVRAYTTMLGVIQPERGHVHLTEIDGDRVVNPLTPGHLTPYQKKTIPTVARLYFRNRLGRALNTDALVGTVTLAASAYDTPPLPLPPPWTGVPVTPAIIRWQLTDRHGRRVIPTQISADFQSTLPPNRQFASVYDTGTYQNFPTRAGRYLYGAHGEYLFNLTASPLDTRALPAGVYSLTVTAVDTCGNRGTLTEKVNIRRQKPLLAVNAAALISPGGSKQRWPRRFWTVVITRFQPPAHKPRFNQTLISRFDKARVGRAALLTDPTDHQVLEITGAFHNWAAAYTHAQEAARGLPGAFAVPVILPSSRDTHTARRQLLRSRPFVGRTGLPTPLQRESATTLGSANTPARAEDTADAFQRPTAESSVRSGHPASA